MPNNYGGAAGLAPLPPGSDATGYEVLLHLHSLNEKNPLGSRSDLTTDIRSPIHCRAARVHRERRPGVVEN